MGAGENYVEARNRRRLGLGQVSSEGKLSSIAAILPVAGRKAEDRFAPRAGQRAQDGIFPSHITRENSRNLLRES